MNEWMKEEIIMQDPLQLPNTLTMKRLDKGIKFFVKFLKKIVLLNSTIDY